MALRREHTGLRPQPTRLKDVTRRQRSGNGAANHDAGGRFTAGNKAAEGKRLKAIIRRHLGRDATNADTEALYREVRDIFAALVASVGSSMPQVQDTLARRARWGVLSAHYALRAVDLGLETEQGQACLELALKLDQRAERLDITAIDLANRLGDDSGSNGANPILAAIEAAGRKAGNE
jgi:hypothetical protein